MQLKLSRWIILYACILGMQGCSTNQGEEEDRTFIRPMDENPFYWEYKGEPVMLIGASKDDNLFQVRNLEDHLDELQSGGVNYVRNTMSERIVNGNEIPAFGKSDGLYDLRTWNEAYWKRFSDLLRWCRERDIIVQVEVWATHDLFGREQWNASPWNPANNVNYSFESTCLTEEVSPRANGFHPFFNTVPDALHDTVVLSFQKAFVDKVLSYTLCQPNVLYCITNEIQHAQSKHWGWYWADYIREQASANEAEVFVTEMYWAPDLKDEQHKLAYESNGHYDYFESSQNSAKSGQENWDNLRFIRDKLKEAPIPINSVKIYGKSGEVKWPGSSEEAVDRFWRNVLGGCASSRFHRDENGKYGLGWSPLSAKSVRAMRLFLEQMKPWQAVPANHLLLDRETNEAYAMADTGRIYGIFFPHGGSVGLDLRGCDGEFRLKWINITRGEPRRDALIQGGQTVNLSSPSEIEKWVAVLRADTITE